MVIYLSIGESVRFFNLLPLDDCLCCLFFRYDTDVVVLLKRIIQRLYPSIHEYKATIEKSEDENNTKDVPFGTLYKELLKKYSHESILSLLLHLDGIPVTKSTKLKMWMFSGAILELPPKIRYRRFNMVVLSIWVGYVEPPPHIWLKASLNNLEMAKSRG